MLNTPSTEPSAITAGDTITWTRSLPDYPASGGWTLQYSLRGPAVIDITGSAQGADHLISVPSATSSSYAAGSYSIQGFVSKSGQRFTVYQGSIVINPNLSAVSGTYDGRSHVKKTLEAIEAVIEGRATSGDQETTIDGVKLVKMTVEQLLVMRSRYLMWFKQEQQRIDRANGKATGRRILTRFT